MAKYEEIRPLEIQQYEPYEPPAISDPERLERLEKLSGKVNGEIAYYGGRLVVAVPNLGSYEAIYDENGVVVDRKHGRHAG